MRRLKSKYNTIDLIRNSNLGFEISNEGILLLLGQKVDDDPNYLKELENNLQQDLLSFRYLLHPTRLMILKVLYGEYKISSSSLRQVLGITWGDFGTHRKSLLEKGYIEMKGSFSESASINQMIYLTEQGKQEYEMLVILLQQFVEEKTPYHYLLHSDNMEADDRLYPKE